MTAVFVIGAIVGVGVFYVVVPIIASAYRRFRGTRVVTCPETRDSAAVEVDSRHAALTALLGGTELRLQDCSRWPDRQSCGQDCLRQIELAPEECLVRTILTKWYRERGCALCGVPFEGIEAWGHRTALLTPSGNTIEWSTVRSEKLRAVLATCQPVCWNCHVAESFRQQRPELVIERRLLH